MSTSWSVKYRPTTLEQVLGQEFAVATILGWQKRKMTPNAILLTGSTGSGKTTLSQIIAARLSKWEGDPADNPDLQDTNVGSERTIGDIRDLVKLSKLMPRGSRRVIVLDEVHALPVASVNALLKALEDPKTKTTWILCTDQPNKIASQPLVGRCSPVALSNIEPATLLKLYRRVAKREKLEIPSNIMEELATAAHGQPRLGLQMLETTVSAIAGGMSAKEALVKAIESNPMTRAFDAALEYLQALIQGSTNKALRALVGLPNGDGVLTLANLMLESAILVAVGGRPISPVGWATTKKISIAKDDLANALIVQTRIVQAMDIQSRYTVPSMSLLLSMARG